MLVVDPEKTQTRWPGEASIEQVPNWRALGEQCSLTSSDKCMRDGVKTYVNLLYTPQAHQVFPLDFEPAFFGGGICRFHRSLRLSNLRV